MRNYRTLRSLARHLIPNAGTIILLALFLWVQSAGAFPFRAPQGPDDVRISYQGRLAGADGLPLAGAYEMTFALYTGASGGSPVWSETHASVAVNDGLFSVLLGSVIALPDPMPVGNLYLGITVGGEEITPRSLLSSSYHALETSLAATVADGAVGTAQLADSGVTAAKIAADAVGTAQIADESLTAADLAPDSVGSSEVADNSLQAVDLAPDSVNVSEIAAGAVGSSEVADNSLQAVDLAPDSVNASEIAANAVGNSELASNAVASANIQDGQVSSADIANNTITETDISDSFKARDADKLDNLDSSAYLHVSGDTMEGPLAIGNQGTIEAKTDSGGAGPHMVFETGDCFVFQNAAMRLRLCGDQYGVSFIGHTWFYFNDTIVPGEDSSYDLGSSGNRRWRSIYVRNVYSGDISEDKDLDFKADTGDVVVWQNDRLVKSTEANDPTVFGVAKVTDDRPAGSPVTLGIFVVKVTGPVREGDILVTSQIPGYAMATDDPVPGAAIAQALEDFEGERGLIKAMIRKF